MLKLEIADFSTSKKRFFVRVSGNIDEKLAKINEVFRNVLVIKLEELDDEFAFMTDVISEQKYEEAASQIDGIITRIRVE